MFTQFLILCVLISLFVIAVYFVCSWLAWSFSSRLDIPFIPTPYSSLSLIQRRLAVKKGDVVYDIGCGDGRVLFYCARRHPDARFIGLELNPFFVFWMQVRKFLTRTTNVEIRRENIFTAEMSDATKIYAFLLQDLTDKFFSAGRFPGVRVVSRAYQISRATPVEIFRITPHDIWYGGHLAYVYEL